MSSVPHGIQISVRGRADRHASSTMRLQVVRMKTNRIRTDIIYITFVFIFLSEFGFEYG